MDLRDIDVEKPFSVPSSVTASLTGIIDYALEVALQSIVLNVVLRGPCLSSDVQVLLNESNNYSTDLFLEEITQVLQSNAIQ